MAAGRIALALVWLASAVVIAVCALAWFRLGFAEDLSPLARVNGPRVSNHPQRRLRPPGRHDGREWGTASRAMRVWRGFGVGAD